VPAVGARRGAGKATAPLRSSAAGSFQQAFPMPSRPSSHVPTRCRCRQGVPTRPRPALSCRSLFLGRLLDQCEHAAGHGSWVDTAIQQIEAGLLDIGYVEAGPGRRRGRSAGPVTRRSDVAVLGAATRWIRREGDGRSADRSRWICGSCVADLSAFAASLSFDMRRTLSAASPGKLGAQDSQPLVVRGIANASQPLEDAEAEPARRVVQAEARSAREVLHPRLDGLFEQPPC
jgi:hypothetical protein